MNHIILKEIDKTELKNAMQELLDYTIKFEEVLEKLKNLYKEEKFNSKIIEDAISVMNGKTDITELYHKKIIREVWDKEFKFDPLNTGILDIIKERGNSPWFFVDDSLALIKDNTTWFLVDDNKALLSDTLIKTDFYFSSMIALIKFSSMVSNIYLELETQKINEHHAHLLMKHKRG